MKAIFQPKYLLLWDRMGDYHRARVRELMQLIGKDKVWGGDLGGADEMYSWESGNGSENYFRLSEKPVEKIGMFEGWWSFRKIVRKEHISHVCIPGYGRNAYILMIIWSRLAGKKVLIFAESWYPGSIIIDRLKGLFLNWFTHACFVSGERARIHFTRQLHYPSKKIFYGYSVVDNNHFTLLNVKKSLPPQLLCVARFSEEKNLELLIRAFKRSGISKKWTLKIVGGGPKKQVLQKQAEGSPIQLTDWLSYDELPELYVKASCFVLPSHFEPWGLVVNEAMAAGLPLILSDKIGALPDLLENQMNGWQFEDQNEDDLVRVLNDLSLLDEKHLVEMGKKSSFIITRFSTRKWAEAIVSHLN
jgi:glycosyltransferase involved in cell wall biosynthesis